MSDGGRSNGGGSDNSGGGGSRRNRIMLMTGGAVVTGGGVPGILGVSSSSANDWFVGVLKGFVGGSGAVAKDLGFCWSFVVTARAWSKTLRASAWPKRSS
jgi:hypothetical protein